MAHFFVNDMETNTFSSTLHFGDQITQFLDRLHLFFQILALKEIGQLRIAMGIRQLV